MEITVGTRAVWLAGKRVLQSGHVTKVVHGIVCIHWDEECSVEPCYDNFSMKQVNRFIKMGFLRFD